MNQASDHDYTKMGKYLPIFTRALKNDFEDDSEVKDFNWWNFHTETERHHLNNSCPDDVNIVDVVEMLCDCVCAGLARNGKVYTLSIDKDILEKAVSNTIDLLINNIEVVDK